MYIKILAQCIGRGKNPDSKNNKVPGFPSAQHPLPSQTLSLYLLSQYSLHMICKQVSGTQDCTPIVQCGLLYFSNFYVQSSCSYFPTLNCADKIILLRELPKTQPGQKKADIRYNQSFHMHISKVNIPTLTPLFSILK